MLWIFENKIKRKKTSSIQDIVENINMRVNMNKTKVSISREQQKVMQKAVRWPCGVCGRCIGNNSIYVLVRSGYTGNVAV